MKKFIPAIIFFLTVTALFSLFYSQPSYAASLSNVSDTISTSATASAALHTIKLTPVTMVPSNGKIVLTFQGDANNTAVASSSAFAFNSLSSSQIQVHNASCSITVSAPSITCSLSASVSANMPVTFLLGCTAQTDGTCTTSVPTILNPTKSKASGTADVWTIRVKTLGGAGNELDTSKAKIATLEQVRVVATVEETLTFSITGIDNATAINTGNTVGCTNTELTNSSQNSNAITADLGRLTNTPSTVGTKISNITAQLLAVTTNATNGYSLTATSSGKLTNTANNSSINSSTTPGLFPSGAAWFGIHPCGLDVSATTWTSGSSHACNSYITGSTGTLCKYAWPDSTPISIASKSQGPIGDTLTPGLGLTSIEYAAGIDSSVSAGQYRTVITYTVTPSF